MNEDRGQEIVARAAGIMFTLVQRGVPIPQALIEGWRFVYDITKVTAEDDEPPLESAKDAQEYFVKAADRLNERLQKS
jgi:hypothetical protein